MKHTLCGTPLLGDPDLTKQYRAPIARPNMGVPPMVDFPHPHFHDSYVARYLLDLVPCLLGQHVSLSESASL